MKKILIVSPCGKRRDTIGLIGGLLSSLEGLNKNEYHITLFDTNFFENNHNPADYRVDCYCKIDRSLIDDLIMRIPILYGHYFLHRIIATYKKLLLNYHYDVVIVYQIPGYADKLVRIAHDCKSKIVFEPLGSDILRVGERAKKKLSNAFSEVDAVVGRSKSNVLIAAQKLYKVSEEKIKEQRVIIGGVILLKKLQGQLSRIRMHDEVGIPYSNYNIVCGYSGRESHRHRLIIDSLIKVKDVLPQDYQIIFPMTYGAGTHHEIIINYAAKLKEICDEAGLKTVFLTDFKSSEQMAYLHLITDLFVEIQPTDNGNAFMIEALYAHNQIVTGRWLKYERFEQFGEPYYLIDKPEDLSTMLKNIFTHQVKKAIVPQALVDFIDVPENYDRSSFWKYLFDSL